ncbi:D-alanyl-D-alanine carboxypeptidase family protein [Lusitaniella coriacea LEGE 07157]|uniref:D-alanyl-D-alanine carboxypeptidase family protein n=1 Tax=Lusitaniella coriacea LEGE 07157 TaxID=945747 RepID=A0A8J7JA62_9CYAN|nr:M15 family metallopeptidase [Lusitaniella coriacea]MBE9116055.1 D-alanyl-D-alanine carboxypeptidase family protein [Lusitaniella coriacea LEGE 07157]
MTTLDSVNKASKPGQPAIAPVESSNDIPVAKRKQTQKKQPKWLKPTLYILGGVGLGAIVVLSSVLLLMQASKTSPTATPSEPETPAEQSSPAESVDTPDVPAVENVLGHLPYEAAPESELQSLSANAQIRLRKAAAQKFNEMSASARASGISLVPLSGFRTVEEQNHLFFGVKAQRNQNASQRAEVSAPPGYSEHHTGYAMDIGDGNVPSVNLSQGFEQTAAFQWLEKNAARYGFELSFPPDNIQGVSYEPWHWRFVGDIQSLETFYRAHNLPTSSTVKSDEQL